MSANVFKRSAVSALIAVAFCGFVCFGEDMITRNDMHNTDTFPGFASVEAIDQAFKLGGVSIKMYRMQKHDDRCIVAAYPYTGLDTIDVYCFIKHGDKWRIQMLYFALHPAERTLVVKESKKAIAIMDGKKELVTISCSGNLQ